MKVYSQKPSVSLSQTTRLVIAIIFFSVLLCFLTWQLLSHLNNLGRGDWDQFYYYSEVPQITLFKYHQFPFWNPYSCGGMPMLANPQSRFLSPSIIFTSIFGVVAGLKLEIFFCLLFGMLGMYFLADHLKIKWPTVFVPGIIFGLNGTFALHLTEGQFHVLPAVYFPYVFLFFLKSFEKKRFVILSSLFMGLSFLEGGTYVTLFFLIFILLFSILKSFEIKTFKPIGLYFIFLLSAILWAAPKAFPAIEYLTLHPRPTDPGGYIPLLLLKNIFLSQHQGMFGVNIPSFSSNIGWWEVGAYLGVVSIGLYFLSFFLILDNYPILLAGLACLVIGMGNFSSFSFWHLLHQIPPFSSMYVPTRIFIVFIFSLALMSGLALDKISQNWKQRNVIILFIIILLSIDLLTVGRNIFSQAIRPYTIDNKHQISLFQPSLSDFKNFRQTYVPNKDWFQYGAWSTLHRSLLNNEGVINAYESIPVKNEAIPFNVSWYNGEFYLKDPGIIKLLQWSPNKIKFFIYTSVENTIIVNQNFDHNWQASIPFKTNSTNGLLSVTLPPMKGKILLSYSPASFYLGLFCFFVMFLLCFYLYL